MDATDVQSRHTSCMALHNPKFLQSSLPMLAQFQTNNVQFLCPFSFFFNLIFTSSTTRPSVVELCRLTTVLHVSPGCLPLHGISGNRSFLFLPAAVRWSRHAHPRPNRLQDRLQISKSCAAFFLSAPQPSLVQRQQLRSRLSSKSFICCSIASSSARISSALSASASIHTHFNSGQSSYKFWNFQFCI